MAIVGTIIMFTLGVYIVISSVLGLYGAGVIIYALAKYKSYGDAGDYLIEKGMKIGIVIKSFEYGSHITNAIKAIPLIGMMLVWIFMIFAIIKGMLTVKLIIAYVLFQMVFGGAMALISLLTIGNVAGDFDWKEEGEPA